MSDKSTASSDASGIVRRTCRAVIIEVPDLDTAVEAYRCLLNSEPTDSNDAVSLFALQGLELELRQAKVKQAAVVRVCIVADKEETLRSPLEAFEFTRREPPAIDAMVALDMVCYMTGDGDGTRAKLAESPLDLVPRKTVKMGPGELSFYKLGTTLLELISNPGAKSEGFWGLSFRVDDLNAYHEYLTARGVTISEIRAGRKPGTRVATVKSHNLGLPTLLLGPA